MNGIVFRVLTIDLLGSSSTIGCMSIHRQKTVSQFLPAYIAEEDVSSTIFSRRQLLLLGAALAFAGCMPRRGGGSASAQSTPALLQPRLRVPQHAGSGTALKLGIPYPPSVVAPRLR